MISSRAVNFSVTVLIACFVAAVVTARWFASQIGATGLHGPVAIVPALPFAFIFVIGSLVLATIVIVQRLPARTTFIGLLPAGILVVILAALLSVTLVAG